MFNSIINFICKDVLCLAFTVFATAVWACLDLYSVVVDLVPALGGKPFFFAYVFSLSSLAFLLVWTIVHYTKLYLQKTALAVGHVVLNAVDCPIVFIGNPREIVKCILLTSWNRICSDVLCPFVRDGVSCTIGFIGIYFRSSIYSTKCLYKAFAIMLNVSPSPLARRRDLLVRRVAEPRSVLHFIV